MRKRRDLLNFSLAGVITYALAAGIVLFVILVRIGCIGIGGLHD